MRSILRPVGAGLGLGVLLATTARPALAHGVGAPAPSAATLLGTWSPDALVWTAVLAAAATYLLAVRAVNRAHPLSRVRPRRAAAWLGGLAGILVALVSAVDVYAEDLLSVHMVQHLVLTMVVPPLLALGAPVTLLLRVAGPRARHRLVLPALHSRLVRLMTSPFVALPALAIVMWATHFTPLYDAALEDPRLHIAEHAVYLTAGLLFWWPVVAADPSPTRLGYGARLAWVGLQMPVSAAIGLAIYFAPTVLYAHYATLERPWGPDALVDQQIGGLVMWAVGDLLFLAAVPVLLWAWMRADVRRAGQLDARMPGGPLTDLAAAEERVRPG